VTNTTANGSGAVLEASPAAGVHPTAAGPPPSPVLVTDSTMPMVVLLFSAIALGVVFVFRKRIRRFRRATARRKYHNISETTKPDSVEGGIAMIDVPLTDDTDDGEITKEDIET
tara:strand:+ start:138 stop:479 length:342 start_codon:yes stop_codon:yes gene_type:complete